MRRVHRISGDFRAIFQPLKERELASPCGTQLTAALKPRKRASPYRAAISGLIVAAPIVARILLMERRTASREAALAF